MRWPYWAITIAYCAIIFWCSSQAISEEVKQYDFAGLDKIVHAIEFGGLAAVVAVGIRRSKPHVSGRVQRHVPVLFAVCYGLTDEVHQLFVPERTFDLLDLAADAAGAWLVCWILCRRIWRLDEKDPRPSSGSA